MSIFDNLKNAGVEERTVEISGQKILVRGLKRSEKNQLHTEATSSKGKFDGVKWEALMLAACCLDPDTNEPIQPDYREWDLPAYICGPLVAAVIQVNGLDEDEAKALVKKSDSTPS